LVEYDGKPVMKLSPGKRMYPGRKQVFRGKGEDTLSLFDEKLGGEPLLEKVIENGKLVKKLPKLNESREFFLRRFSELPNEIKDIHRKVEYPVHVSEKLKKLYESLERELEEEEIEGAENNND
jgi:nicotinate phosphoribosyltransferase